MANDTDTLHSSDASYRSFFEDVPVGLFRTTLAGTILDANPAFLHMLSYPDREALIQGSAADLYVDPGAWTHWVALLESTGAVTDFESQLRRRDGDAIWVRASARVVRDAAGRSLYVEGAAVDVTQRKEIEGVLERRTTEVEAFHDLGRLLRAAHSADEMYPIIVQQTMRLLASQYGALQLLNEDRDALIRVYTAGIPFDQQRFAMSQEDEWSGHVIKVGTPFVSGIPTRETLPASADESRVQEVGPVAVVPVRSEDEIIGTIELGRSTTRGNHPYTDAEVRLMESVAEIAGTAIRRADLNYHLEQSYLDMVRALARAADARDRYAADHSERIASRAAAIAQALGCEDQQVRDIRWAGLLHDIGKLGVPDSILQKPGPLTEAEWSVIRQHPSIGEDILRPVDRMRHVATLVRHHQERWDGTGYPDGLRGEDIPLGARILAVADACGAITDGRGPRAGRSLDEAVAEIRRCSGTQFDPSVVEVFCRLAGEGRIDAPVADGREARPGGSVTPPRETAIARSLSQAERVGRIIPAMADVAKRLLRPLDLAAVLDEILGQIEEIFGYPACAVWFADAQAQELHVTAQRGYDPDAVKEFRLRIGDGIAGWVAKHERAYYAPDVAQDPLYVPGPVAARSLVVYPLVVESRVIGVLTVASPNVDAFPRDIRAFLDAFAALAALAILRAQRDADLHRLALTDALTGLGNRRALWDALEREIARARRNRHPVSVALVEIDAFKHINDRFGHLQGDVALRKMADVLRTRTRATDLSARFGGDEFVLLLPDVPKRTAAQVAERIRSYVAEIVLHDEARLTVSIGVATMPEDGETAEAVVEGADRAAYDAKHAGGNRVRCA